MDVWCLGILLFELCHGKAPFTGENPREIGKKIMAKKLVFKKGLSLEYQDLVFKLLERKPNDRIPLIEVFDHPWVRSFEKRSQSLKVP